MSAQQTSRKGAIHVFSNSLSHFCIRFGAQLDTISILTRCKKSREIAFRKAAFSRVLPFTGGVLSRLDLLGRFVLHRQYHAPVHDQRRPVLELAIPYEIRAEQDQTTCYFENHLRVASQHRYEPAIEPHVLEGNSAFSSVFGRL